MPLYKVVRDAIIDRICSGELKPGIMLASEVDLGKEFGVSQGTARKALIELEHRKLIERQQGRGSFIKIHTPEYSLFHFFRLQKLDGTRDTPQLEHESIVERDSSDLERECLFDHPAKIFELKRVRSLSGAKTVVETTVLLTELFSKISEHSPLPKTLYDFYQDKYSIMIVRADEEIEAIALDYEAATKLDQEVGMPALRVIRRSIDLRERVVEFRTSILLTSHHRYFVTLS